MRPTRERTDRIQWFRTDLPHGVMVPAGKPSRLTLARAAAAPVLRPVRRFARAVATETAVFIAAAAFIAVFHQASVMQLSPPRPPAGVCGSSSLNGPSSPPGGAVTVAAGDNSAVNFGIPGATYWFAAGIHTLGTGVFAQIIPGDNSVFTGAPGAILDGQGLNHFAFGGSASGVTVEYLTVQDFTPPGAQGAVNNNGEPGWTVQYDTIQDNVPGAGMMAGTNSTVTGDCLTQNGEYGFNAYTISDVSPVTGGPSGIVMTGNEISFNDTCNWEDIPSPHWPYPAPPAGCTGAGQYVGCGCSGAAKFWEAYDDTFTGNYVHDNYANGIWWDTNNAGSTIDGNYFADNWGAGAEYEISYNAQIEDNTFTGNALGVGPYNPGFPSSAIYISESGSDPRVAGPYGTEFDISGNGFYDNWGGVVLYENSNRYCTSAGNSSTGTCTLVNPQANLMSCGSPLPAAPSRPAGRARPAGRRTLPGAGTAQGQASKWLIAYAPYVDDCRWKTQNVKVYGNIFDFSPAVIGAACTTGNNCGFNGLFSEFGSIYPFKGEIVPEHITFSQADLFSGNTYCGPWQWMQMDQGAQVAFPAWQASPYSQDPGSSVNGPACSAQPPYSPQPPSGQRTVTIPVRSGRR